MKKIYCVLFFILTVKNYIVYSIIQMIAFIIQQLIYIKPKNETKLMFTALTKEGMPT